MKKISKQAFIIMAISFLPMVTLAWGTLGHRIIGEIADSYLSKKARKNIAAILGTESVAMSSNWADFIKSDPSYNYLGNWHYINIKSGLTEEAFKAYLDADTATDAYTKINFLATALKKDDLPQDKKIMYLRLLIHIVGDVHQPLHVGRLEDQGGNRIRVLWFKDSINLHQLWDDRLIAFQQLSYTEYATAVNHAGKEEVKAMKNEPVSTWLFNSYQIAEKIYGEIKTPYQKLDYKYNFDYVDILNRQLLQGGVHLAGLLNEIFG
ncbi:MAG: S1/P1 nuclease [Ferruginibacter sp.]